MLKNCIRSNQSDKGDNIFLLHLHLYGRENLQEEFRDEKSKYSRTHVSKWVVNQNLDTRTLTSSNWWIDIEQRCHKLLAPLQKLKSSICFLDNEDHTLPLNYILYYFCYVQSTQHASYSLHDQVALSVSVWMYLLIRLSLDQVSFLFFFL